MTPQTAVLTASATSPPGPPAAKARGPERRPNRIWQIAVRGSIPLTFFDEKAAMRRVTELRRRGHEHVEVWTAEISDWQQL